MSINQVRDGRSLTMSHSNVTFKQLLKLGLTAASAKRAMRVRRVLPYMEDATIPCIDARRLWSQLGKPHSRFNQWADYHLKPLLNKSKLNTEISVFEDASKAGKPTKEYTLSRYLATHLAMMVDTKQSWEVKDYFIDMEKVVFGMAEFNNSRAITPSKLDKRLTLAAINRAGRAYYVAHMRKLQDNLCKILTGMGAGEIKHKHGKRVRDILQGDLAKMDVYNEAYAMAIRMYSRGKSWVQIAPFLKEYFGRSVDVQALIRMQ